MKIFLLLIGLTLLTGCTSKLSEKEFQEIKRQVDEELAREEVFCDCDFCNGMPKLVAFGDFPVTVIWNKKTKA